MRASDTTPEAHEAQRRAIQRLAPARRVEMAFEMSEQAREAAIRGALSRAPGLTHEEARAELLRRLLGDALYRAAWPTRTRR
jgi:HEPN domain-containing protein